MIRKATDRDIESIAGIYARIHEAEAAGRLTTGWLKDVYPTGLPPGPPSTRAICSCWKTAGASSPRPASIRSRCRTTRGSIGSIPQETTK